jgi:hypothetical protein
MARLRWTVMRSAPAAALLGLVICLLLAGCARSAGDADQDRHSGFYGGISGGMN